MPKEAAGAYLRYLREAHRLGRPSVANALLTSENQIKRIEDGAIDSRGSLLLSFCKAVGGNPTDLEYLMSIPETGPDDGRSLAQEWLNAQGQPLTDEERSKMQATFQTWMKEMHEPKEVLDEETINSRIAIAVLRRLIQPVHGTIRM